MRLLALGDIHGCRTAFDALLALVQPGPDDVLVTLGDYVDRGPDSRGVLERLLELHQTGPMQLVPLRGNHEQMMTEARSGEGWRSWLAFGGRQTLASYGGLFPDREEMRRIPDRHWVFLEYDCHDWYETDGHLFVHASLEPDLPMQSQPPEVLRWQKLEGPLRHVSGKVVVCGHTPQSSGRPLDLGSTICIDTGVYSANGWLTCLDVQSRDYWQANERGETRTGRLGVGEAEAK